MVILIANSSFDQSGPRPEDIVNHRHEDEYGRVALHIAVENCDLAAAEMLAQWGADVNMQVRPTDTALIRCLFAFTRDSWMF